MLEIEVKSPCDDLQAVERKVGGLGGAFKKELKQTDVYLAHPCRDFARTDEALRLRQENERFVLYYKGPKLDRETKTREELSTPVPDPASLLLVLQRLGFRIVTEVRKTRKVYELRGVEVALDSVEGLGSFVELEVQGSDVEKGKRMLFDLMAELGLERTVRSSYLELLLEKSNKA
jgi:adenylate cyclase class 2